MKHESPNRIYWFCFKRQLIELYLFLLAENYISCGIDEFTSHFTGKKFIVDEEFTDKLKWNSEKCLLKLVADHLIEKKFIENSGIIKHFICAPASKTNKQTPSAIQIQRKLEALFPAETGYRCKQRLYYRERNKENMFSVLAKLGVHTSSPAH